MSGNSDALSKALVASSKNRKDARFLGEKHGDTRPKKSYGYELRVLCKGRMSWAILSIKNMEILDGI